MDYKLSNEERETLISFNDGNSTASVYTCDKKLIKQLDKFCKKRPDLYDLSEKDGCFKSYGFPKKLITFRVPRVLSRKQKERLSEIGFKKKA